MFIFIHWWHEILVFLNRLGQVNLSPLSSDKKYNQITIIFTFIQNFILKKIIPSTLSHSTVVINSHCLMIENVCLVYINATLFGNSLFVFYPWKVWLYIKQMVTERKGEITMALYSQPEKQKKKFVHSLKRPNMWESY